MNCTLSTHEEKTPASSIALALILTDKLIPDMTWMLSQTLLSFTEADGAGYTNPKLIQPDPKLYWNSIWEILTIF
ncbi:MAG: hypothetical protein A3G34_17300 [Candidatus Lindowbacteria bacterium RIFCSPLOWO2_12_FULL_62_27]|nr:MAG: hypothetical protein A3G34_17300 [Candidatus Lindowbacteria bacterium RIFCSPLOWO2_12_FULL_62_27]OGH62192.1 MAG: hypothetical protein A3I06_01440 [Candidatus Lindowbacteria bacterium RIFCSPLOWO2_02_FULL_62_12]